jgi:hypothetical protein
MWWIWPNDANDPEAAIGSLFSAWIAPQVGKRVVSWGRKPIFLPAAPQIQRDGKIVQYYASRVGVIAGNVLTDQSIPFRFQ